MVFAAQVSQHQPFHAAQGAAAAERQHRLHLPGGFTYMPIVAGGVLMVLFALERLVLRASGIRVDHDPNAEEVALSEV